MRFKVWVIRFTAAVAAFAAAVGLGACGHDMQQTKREVFLSVIHHQYKDTRNAKMDNAMVSLAHDVCGALNRGATANDVISSVVMSAGSAAQAREFGFIIGAGVKVYCPKYTKDFTG